MDIIIQSLGFTADENLESLIHEKLEKFDKERKKSKWIETTET